MNAVADAHVNVPDSNVHHYAHALVNIGVLFFADRCHSIWSNVIIIIIIIGKYKYRNGIYNFYFLMLKHIDCC